MADELRWGILGTALIAKKCVIPAISASTNGTIQALASSRPDEAGPLAESHRIPVLCDDFDELLALPTVDAVYIPLPNQLHETWVTRALRAGKHVLCEKPLACSAAEALAMARAAAGSGLLLMEAQMYRFHPRTRRIEAMVAAGAVGIPRMVRAAFCFSMAEELLAAGNNYRLASPTGGGALLDVGCYGVGIARLLLGKPVTRVQATAVRRAENGIDLQLVGSLDCGGEALASIEASFISGLQQTYSVSGSGGAIDLPHDAFIPWGDDTLFYHRAAGSDAAAPLVVPGDDQYRLMVEHFGDRVRTGKPPLVPLEDSIATMAVLDALAESARTGTGVDVRTQT